MPILTADALDTQWATDKSAALLVQNNGSESCKAAQLVELNKGRATRINDLQKQLDGAFSAYYLKHPPVGAKGDAPPLKHQFEDWRMDGSDRVSVECQATAKFPADSEALWSARLDGVGI